jgi:hypothetical protein
VLLAFTDGLMRTNHFDQECRALADRHYTRRPGSVGKRQFCYSGRKLVLRNAEATVVYVWMWPQDDRTRASVTDIRTLDAIHGAIHANVEVGSQLYTDDHMVFNDLDGLFYSHESVNHSAGEYARGLANTNSIESVWAVLKRGIHGVYHQVSPKHLHRYVDEFTFRLNEGDVKRHTMRRLESFIDAIVGKRLTYERLIAKVGA